MAEQSRTSKSLKNIAVALLFLAVNLLLQFFCRDVFLERLGAEVLGLNTTAGNLLQFLNIAELGIGVAVGFSLYKPLFDKDTQRINEIISLQGHMYRRIALIVIAGAVVLGAFFPFIFSKMKLPLWYAYASFGVLLVSALLSYFVNYKEVLLSADQKEYKITYSYKACMMARLIVQYFIIKNCENPYIWWLVLEGGFAVIASIALSAMVRHTYPFLKTGISTSAELKKKYPEIVTKIKQIFFHKISTFVLQQTSPLIIYAFASLTLVTYYTNYTTITIGLALLLNALFNSIGAGVGNLVASGDKQRIMNVFDELFSVRFYISAGASIALYILTPSFITLWIGEQYILPQSTLAIICFTLFLNASRTSVDSYINAYGLFQDVWAPIAEACLNLGLSVLFGWIWGLNGILMGVVVSLLLIVFLWKPYFLFRWGLKEPIGIYIRLYMRHIAAIFATLSIIWIIDRNFSTHTPDNAKEFTLFALGTVLATGTILYAFQMAFTKGMRMFTRRIISKTIHR